MGNYDICLIIGFIFLSTILFSIEALNANPWKNKRIEKYLKTIKICQAEGISFHYKGKEFLVQIEYSTKDEHYNKITALINGEKVLDIHIFKGEILTHRKVDFEYNRKISEVLEIIKVAFKVSKGRIALRDSNKFDRKSFFSK